MNKPYRRGEKAVEKLAEGMLAKLAKRSDRGAWLDETLEALLFALEHELLVEVKGAYRSYQKGIASLEDLQQELYDVANYCMMASDKIDEMLGQ